MSVLRAQAPISPDRGKLVALLATPAMAIFVTSNLVNVGNLTFNLLFSRWMGPELFGDLTVLLTIKLALLGMLGAFQSAVSQKIAAEDASGRQNLKLVLAKLNKAALVIGFIALPVIGFALVKGDAGGLLGLESTYLLLMLMAALPVASSLSVLRGVALGQMIVSKIVFSSLVEMAVRLIGAIIVWQMGFGIEGVVLTIALSIVAGWIVLTDLLPSPRLAQSQARGLAGAISLSALPFGVLYFAQVLALDGDIFLAKALLPAEDAGYVAALLLFQRIQFFACFALASVLLPAVVATARTGSNFLPATAPILALFFVSAVVFLTAARFQPELMISLLVGSQYADAAAGLMLAALSAVAFTLSFLIATFLAALNDRNGIWATAVAAILQLVIMAVFTKGSSVTFINILEIKCAVQCTLAFGLTTYTGLRLTRMTRSQPNKF